MARRQSRHITAAHPNVFDQRGIGTFQPGKERIAGGEQIETRNQRLGFAREEERPRGRDACRLIRRPFENGAQVGDARGNGSRVIVIAGTRRCLQTTLDPVDAGENLRELVRATRPRRPARADQRDIFAQPRCKCDGPGARVGGW
jgi:hypothetical protein